MESIRGLHHVTAIATDAQDNADFYVGVLGMRMVKRTVNQDAPETYHLFYADEVGNPGTDLTFFIWPDVVKGRLGTGQCTEVAFAVAPGSLDYWSDRLRRFHVKSEPVGRRFGEPTLRFHDSFGTALALVEALPSDRRSPWAGSTVPPDRQVLGFHSVRICVADGAPSIDFLRNLLGFELLGEEAGLLRFGPAGGGAGRIIDVEVRRDLRAGAMGDGTVHHVAWNVGSDEEQSAFRARALSAGASPTEVIDRFWFRSVYFREPGGVLYEAATEGPGFLVDEPGDALGAQLILPPKFEEYRIALEAALPSFSLPTKETFGRSAQA